MDGIRERPIRTAAEKYIADCVSHEAGIVERLRDMLDGPVPMYVTRQDIRDIINEIERLYQKEHDILAGIQLVVKGSNAGRDQEIERLSTELDAISLALNGAQAENIRLRQDNSNILAGLQVVARLTDDGRDTEVQRLKALGTLDAISGLIDVSSRLAALVLRIPCECKEARDGAINASCPMCDAYLDWQEIVNRVD